MKLVSLFFLIIFMGFYSCLVIADATQDQMQKQIEEVMKAREEMLKSLMDDSNFQDMSKRMEKLMQTFNSNDFFQGSNDVVGEYDWKETKTHLILSLKVKQIKDRPLDIKIKDGQISMKGEVESQSESQNRKNITKVHFERVFSIPQGVDATTPEFENKRDEILIKFKKKIQTSPKKDLVPVGPNPTDLNI